MLCQPFGYEPPYSALVITYVNFRDSSWQCVQLWECKAIGGIGRERCLCTIPLQLDVPAKLHCVNRSSFMNMSPNMRVNCSYTMHSTVTNVIHTQSTCCTKWSKWSGQSSKFIPPSFLGLPLSLSLQCVCSLLHLLGYLYSRSPYSSTPLFFSSPVLPPLPVSISVL